MTAFSNASSAFSRGAFATKAHKSRTPRSISTLRTAIASVCFLM